MSEDVSYLTKHQILNYNALEYYMEGSENVIYFTHDYLTLTADKNDHLIATARAAKTVGAKRLIAVTPIEHDLYWHEEKDPIEKKLEAEAQAFSHFPSMSLIRPNLLYGNYSYFFRYIQQSMFSGFLPQEFMNEDNKCIFYPVHQIDLYKAIRDLYVNHDKHKGKAYNLNGKEETKIRELVRIMELAYDQKVKAQKSYGIGDFLTDFFAGTSHDKNWRLMVDFYGQKNYNFMENDYFTENDINGTERIGTTYFEKRVESSNFVHPTFFSYKNISLD